MNTSTVIRLTLLAAGLLMTGSVSTVQTVRGTVARETRAAQSPAVDLAAITSPIIFAGNETTAYRDPAIFYHRNTFHLFFTLVKIEPDHRVYSYTATSKSTNLSDWSIPSIITPKGQHLNYCSPGNVIQLGDEFVLCLQSYPRRDYTVDQMPRYGDATARIYLMRSKNLEDWSEPEMMMVKGPHIPADKMGRMIDPYLVEDKDQPGKWWCFYKQNGASLSYSFDLKTWHYEGHFPSGENVCVWVDNNAYYLMHSPSNGVGIKKSSDLKRWLDWGELITLGQDEWSWARGRLSAGAVLDLRDHVQVGKYVLFFHGSGPRSEREGDFDRNCSLGLAWSDDLIHWNWPGRSDGRRAPK